ncbi:MAG: HNH endonuclease [Acidobacteriota bacterium]|nr:HNH endonuclease [Acidobacteriota bacterium]
MFFYCTRRLCLSEHAAYKRIEVARVSRSVPAILDALRSGALNLTTALQLAPHLTCENQADLIQSASFKSKREVERFLAERFGKADEPAGYKIQFTADQDTYDKLCLAQALMRHGNPYGLIAPIMNRALTLLIADVERHRAAQVTRPKKVARATAAGSRHIPSDVKRSVWARDGARCAFVGTQGRCGERGFLEYHHVRPFAHGGPATVGNIELRCRAHNVYEAEVLAGVR